MGSKQHCGSAQQQEQDAKIIFTFTCTPNAVRHTAAILHKRTANLCPGPTIEGDLMKATVLTDSLLIQWHV